MTATWRILEGDCRDRLREIDAGSVQTCVTSPPYFGLRDYGHAGQIGLEPTPDEFVQALVKVFYEVRRVLRDDGTVWLNLGDSYGRGFGGGTPGEKSATNVGSFNDREYRGAIAGIKGKDLVGIPWMVAFALRQDGWYLRSDIIWAKPNPMPESVTDRPTKAHEYVFLLSKSARYFYDADAIREEPSDSSGGYQSRARRRREGEAVSWTTNSDTVKALTDPSSLAYRTVDRRDAGEIQTPEAGRNKRSVWTVATQPFAGAHFATFPPKLIEPCILAGCPEAGTVLDPFAGAGTTGLVALRHGRSFIGCELSPEYVELARGRIIDDCPMWNTFAEAA